MFDLLSLTDDAQAAIFILVAEKSMKEFADTTFIHWAQHAINKCWEWVEEKSITGDDLYDIIDSGEEYDIVDLQTESKSDKDSYIWDCVINSVVYTCYKAYEMHNENIPQPIEVADEELFEDAKAKLIAVSKGSEIFIAQIEKYFMDHYRKNDGPHRPFIREEL